MTASAVRVRLLPALSLLLLLASTARAETAVAKAKDPGPPPAPVREVRFPSFAERTLANGLRVVVIEQHEQPVVSLRLVLDAGQTFEPADRAGLAGATAALLTKGTTTRSAQQIAEAIDFVGGSLEASAGIESGYVTAAVTADQLDLGFELLADVVLRPTFPPEELDRWRRQAVGGLQVQMQDASYLASTALQRAVFGDHPYGRPGDGTPESLTALKREDLAGFHARRYVANGAMLAVVGDVVTADAMARVERAFGGWAKGEAAAVPPVAPATAGRRVIVIDKPDAVQTEIRLGQVAIAYRDPDFFAAQVYSSVAGANPNSRLYREIRRKRGLSYGASTDFVETSQPGWFSASTFTKSETTVEALGVALDVLHGLQQAPVPESELTGAKTFITGALPLVIETADGTASRVLEAMKHGYGREYLESYNGRLDAVSAAELQRFASARMKPEAMTLVLVGNAAAFAPALAAKVGPVETIPVAEVDFLRGDLKMAKESGGG